MFPQEQRRRRLPHVVRVILITSYYYYYICIGYNYISVPCTFILGHDIPTKKAMPPLMDPIPVLPEITHRIYIDIAILNNNNNNRKGNVNNNNQNINNENDTFDVGRIVIGLFGHNAPTAVENFRLLATCPKHNAQQKQYQRTLLSKQKQQLQQQDNNNDQLIGTKINKEYNPFCYKGTIFHRIIPNFIIQGGDTTHYNGVGGISPLSSFPYNHNGTYIPYMINQTKFNRPYMVATIATKSKPIKTKNGGNYQQQQQYVARSQFFITTSKTQWLDMGTPTEQYIIFGTILEGKDYLHTIEQRTGTYGGHPSSIVQIYDIGEVPLESYDLEPHY